MEYKKVKHLEMEGEGTHLPRAALCCMTSQHPWAEGVGLNIPALQMCGEGNRLLCRWVFPAHLLTAYRGSLLSSLRQTPLPSHHRCSEQPLHWCPHRHNSCMAKGIPLPMTSAAGRWTSITGNDARVPWEERVKLYKSPLW